jgi:hypothetical protein
MRRPPLWRVFGTRSYFPLWIAPVISSSGDWIGLIAIVAIAARISKNSGAAVSLVMFADVVPGSSSAPSAVSSSTDSTAAR